MGQSSKKRKQSAQDDSMEKGNESPLGLRARRLEVQPNAYTPSPTSRVTDKAQRFPLPPSIVHCRRANIKYILMVLELMKYCKLSNAFELE